MNTRLALLSFILIPLIGVSQYTIESVTKIANTSTEAQLVVESSRMLQEDYYYFSEIIVDKLLEKNPESSNYNYRKGFIVLNSKFDFQTAMGYLEKAVKSVKTNYDMYSSKEKSAPTDAYYHLARCYHLDEQIDKAIEYYNLFKENSRKKSELMAKADLGITQCNLAKQVIASPKSAKVVNIGSPVNTEYPEYSPFISFDGKSLYFTSRRPWEDNSTDEFRDPKLYQYPEDIYVSYLSKGSWTTPKKMDFCDPQVNEATIAVSVDEKRVYAYQDITGNGDIYYSDFVKDQFQVMAPIEAQHVNTNYWETHIAVTPDGKNIYFVSDRPGGYGGRDIYRIVKMPDGRWSDPQNLGPKINSEFDEESPFIAIDNKTMYFASNGPSSIGGFDIFVTVRDDENQWSDPINLGYPINSTGDDLFYTTTVNGKKGYLSSFRKGGLGEKDLYEIENDYLGIQSVVVLKGNIHVLGNAELTEATHVKLKCESCDEKESIVSIRMRDGAFMSTLESCMDYEVIFMKDSTTAIRSEKFNTTCNKKYEEITKDAYIADYELLGAVTDKDSGEPVKDVTVKIFDKKTNQLLETLTTDEAGTFLSKLLNDKLYGDIINYELKFSSKGYLSISKDINEILSENVKLNQSIKLEKTDIGKDLAEMIDLSPIYFDLDKWDIRPDAEIELDKIVKIMNDNPTIRIELGSHTDCRATAAYNMQLSDKRAKASAAYIKSRITNPSRIFGKGYGESRLLNDCGCEGKVESTCSEEEHALNRRTEFRIVKQ
ncbi:MAG: OmpA family protein [Crocinitomicaceae bacterium]|nr:OmpA family protein [Crocinitomicaceae bacterium]